MPIKMDLGFRKKDTLVISSANQTNKVIMLGAAQPRNFWPGRAVQAGLPMVQKLCRLVP
jgi:hypothetical protein